MSVAVRTLRPGHCRASEPFGLSFTVEQPSMWSKWKNVVAECVELMRYVWALETGSVHGCFSASTAFEPDPPDSLSLLRKASISVQQAAGLCVCLFHKMWMHQALSSKLLNVSDSWIGGDITVLRLVWKLPSPWCCSSRLSAQRFPPPSPAAAPCRHSAPSSVQQTPEQQQR